MTAREISLEGCGYMRQRIALSLLSGRPIVVSRIRAQSENVGCKPFEVDLLHLVDKLTNGTKISIDESGTIVTLIPGMLIGGTIEHTCDPEQPVGYYIEFVLMVAPFCKNPLKIHFSGGSLTGSDQPSIDRIQRSVLRMMPKFLGEISSDAIQIRRKESGSVIFECDRFSTLKPCGRWLDPGKIKRIRGVAYRLGRVPVSTFARIIDATKKILLNVVPDVYILCDSRKSDTPSFGLCLSAESTEPHTCYTAEATSETVNKQESGYVTPEMVAEEAVHRLFREIYYNGVTDSVSQPLAILFMALNQPDVSRINGGRLSDTSIEMLRNLKKFFNVHFRITEERPTGEGDLCCGAPLRAHLTCVGIGYKNLSKTLV